MVSKEQDYAFHAEHTEHTETLQGSAVRTRTRGRGGKGSRARRLEKLQESRAATSSTSAVPWATLVHGLFYVHGTTINCAYDAWNIVIDEFGDEERYWPSVKLMLAYPW